MVSVKTGKPLPEITINEWRSLQQTMDEVRVAKPPPGFFTRDELVKSLKLHRNTVRKLTEFAEKSGKLEKLRLRFKTNTGNIRIQTYYRLNGVLPAK